MESCCCPPYSRMYSSITHDGHCLVSHSVGTVHEGTSHCVAAESSVVDIDKHSMHD